jgi:hypothetical protein
MSEPKEHVNGRIPTALMERLRNAVWWIGRGYTNPKVFAQAMDKECLALEKKFNGGKPFPPRESELPNSRKRRKKRPQDGG